MARWIDRKNTPGGPLYREWSSGSDQYATPELTRDEMLAYLSERYTFRAGSIVKTLRGFVLVSDRTAYSFAPGALGIVELPVARPGDYMHVRWCDEVLVTYEMHEDKLGRIVPVDDGIRFFGNLTDLSAEERLDRADRRGTSAQGAPMRSPDSEWETERCRECGMFHHKYKADRDTKLCTDCGEHKDDAGHQPPCKVLK